MKPEHLNLLSNKDWRLNNLYWITDKEGKPTRFRMTPEQREYFEGIHTRNIILKARQLGFTTEVCIIQLDAALFESAKCALIAHTLNDAKRLFREKVKYAYDKLPAEIKAANPASNDSSGELVFKKGGSLYVSTSFRGGTLRYLHVSEFGKICAKYPDKAREIVTGAFEAVSTGCFATIESTAEGRAGYFFDYCQAAEKALLQGKPLSALDWKFFFFSWWKNPQYAIDPVETLPVRLLEYFAEMEAKHGVIVNERQKAWYYAKEKTLGDDMKREYLNQIAAARLTTFSDWKVISDTARGDLTNIITDAVARGVNPRETASVISERLDVSMSKAKTIAQTEQVGALRQAQWNETDWAADRLGLNTGLLWLSALKPTTRTWHASRHGKGYTTEEVRDFYAENGNRYNCYCSQIPVLLNDDGSIFNEGLADKLGKEQKLWKTDIDKYN